MIAIDEVQTFFFRAMREGYAKNDSTKIVTDSTGWKKFVFQDGSWNLIDSWIVGGGYSSGTTLIFFNKVPVWQMHYGGKYSEECISCLKKALLKAYQDNLFCGCRGPLNFEDQGWSYQNLVNRGSVFQFFSGRESITWGDSGEAYGWHQYSGFSLLE